MISLMITVQERHRITLQGYYHGLRLAFEKCQLFHKRVAGYRLEWLGKTAVCPAPSAVQPAALLSIQAQDLGKYFDCCEVKTSEVGKIFQPGSSVFLVVRRFYGAFDPAMDVRELVILGMYE